MLALMFTLKTPLKTELLLLWHRIHLGKIIRAIIAFNAVLILLSVAIDRYISFSVQQNLYENLEDLPYRPYALVLGTSKFVAPGKTNDYYSNRLEAAKSLLEHGKVSYLLLSGDNRTLQYNEPKMMFRDLRKMGVSENLMFRDFAGFRTLDLLSSAKNSIANVHCSSLNLTILTPFVSLPNSQKSTSPLAYGKFSRVAKRCSIYYSALNRTSWANRNRCQCRITKIKNYLIF